MPILNGVMTYVPPVKKTLCFIQKVDLMTGFHTKLSWKKLLFKQQEIYYVDFEILNKIFQTTFTVYNVDYKDLLSLF